MNKKINYKMITVACEARKLTQKALSLKVPHLKQQTLSRIERGLVSLSDSDIDAIAEALDYPVDFFYQEETKTHVSNIYFRKRATIPVKELNKVLAEIRIILKSIDYLLEEVDLIEFPKLAYDTKEGWTPESVATRVRELLGFDRDMPITNIITKIEELGVIVFFYDSGHRKFDGLTSYTDNGFPVIFVNRNMSNERIKFTLIHEFFHLIMHLPCDIEPWRDVEAEANTGTSNFYLPTKPMFEDLKELSYNKLGELKSYWGVSKAAIIRRAKDLGLISIETYKYLNEELGRRGEKPVEHGFVELEKPKIISTIINLLRNDAGYTVESLAKKVFLNVNDYSVFFEPNIVSSIKLRVLHKSA